MTLTDNDSKTKRVSRLYKKDKKEKVKTTQSQKYGIKLNRSPQK